MGVIDNKLQNPHPKGACPTQSLRCFQSSLCTLSHPNHLGPSPLDSRSPCPHAGRCEPHAAPISENDCNPGLFKWVQPASQRIFGALLWAAAAVGTLFNISVNTANAVNPATVRRYVGEIQAEMPEICQQLLVQSHAL